MPMIFINEHNKVKCQAVICQSKGLSGQQYEWHNKGLFSSRV